MLADRILEVDQLAARQCVAGALSAAMREPITGGASVDPTMLDDAWTILLTPHRAATRAELGLGELPPGEADPGPLLRWQRLPMDQRQEAYVRAFGLVVSRACPPMETEYCASADPTHRAQVMADASGFYRAFGVDPRSERPDHAAVEMAFVAFMYEKLRALPPGDAEGAERTRSALSSFVRDHIAWWLPTFAKALERQVAHVSPPSEALAALGGIARLMRAWTALERLTHAVEPSRRIVEPVVSAFDVCDDACHECDDAPR